MEQTLEVAINFAETLREKIQGEVFTEEDIKICFRDKSKVAVLSGISRSLKSEEIIKLKRGVYIFAKRFQRDGVSKFIIANKMYNPSYVSFESALSYYGIIPEAVYVTSSACMQRRKKMFETPIGGFSFDYIPCEKFYIGVERMDDTGAMIAHPLKALFDHVYVRRKRYDNLQCLEDDLRIDLDELETIVSTVSCKELEDLAMAYRKRNTDSFYQMLSRELK